MNTEIKRKDEEKFLKLKIADNECFNSSLTFNELINHISLGNLPLEVSEEDGSPILGNDLFNEIKRVVPFLLKIVDKPRSFIKSLEEKVPVETAKRINHKAVAKLSQDSNDWYARTLLAVKPKNIVSDVNEETIDLYENRFICSLVDRISKLVASRRQYYQDQLKNVDDNNALFAMDKDYHTSSSFPFFNKLSKNDFKYGADTSYRALLEEEIDKISKVEKKIRLIKRSDFYRTLHKKRKVTDPIQKTNILMFEFNYNQAYKLWKLLNQYHNEIKLDNDVDIDETQLDGYYSLYCFINVMSVMYDLGFKETSNHLITYKDNTVKLSGYLNFERGLDVMKISMDGLNIHFKFSNKDRKRYEDEFILYPNFVNFENMNRSAVDDYTQQLLNKFISKEKFSAVTSRYSLVSINMNRCSEDNTFSDKVYRRFYGIGNNFSPDEDTKSLKAWGSYKSGIQIITPVRLRDNFLRLEKIINYHILRERAISSFSKTCPLCGGNHLVQLNNQNWVCHDCGHMISITYCNECDKKKEKPILWVKYGDDKFLKRDDVVRGDFSKNKYYDKMSKLEIIMGEKATTAFELENEESGWKLKTICPYCGVILGDKK